MRWSDIRYLTRRNYDIDLQWWEPLLWLLFWPFFSKHKIFGFSSIEKKLAYAFALFVKTYSAMAILDGFLSLRQKCKWQLGLCVGSMYHNTDTQKNQSHLAHKEGTSCSSITVTWKARRLYSHCGKRWYFQGQRKLHWENVFPVWIGLDLKSKENHLGCLTWYFEKNHLTFLTWHFAKNTRTVWPL